MANAKESESRAADIIKNWLRNRYTLEYLGTWEQINNPNFKVVEFDHFKMQAGLPSFVLSATEWIEKTNAIGLAVKKGKYGGTYAHRDIAFEFGSAISAPFKLYLIKEFQRLGCANLYSCLSNSLVTPTLESSLTKPGNNSSSCFIRLPIVFSIPPTDI